MSPLRDIRANPVLRVYALFAGGLLIGFFGWWLSQAADGVLPSLGEISSFAWVGLALLLVKTIIDWLNKPPVQAHREQRYLSTGGHERRGTGDG